MYSKTQMKVLFEVTRSSENLRRSLEQIQDQANSVLGKMREGKQVGHYGGPLSNQTPFDIVQHNERLHCWITTATVLKIESEHIQMAFNLGVADSMSEAYEELWQKISALLDEDLD